MENRSALEIQNINKRLAETIAWCESRVDLSKPETCFRSKELEPTTQLVWAQNHIQRNTIFERVSNIRRAILFNNLDNQNVETPNLSLGKILVFDIDASLVDGAACTATNRFFDDENTPPWDTWFAYLSSENPDSSDMLLSWISNEFVPLIDYGIYVNPEECIYWLKEGELQKLFNQKNLRKYHDYLN